MASLGISSQQLSKTKGNTNPSYNSFGALTPTPPIRDLGSKEWLILHDTDKRKKIYIYISALTQRPRESMYF